MKDWIAKLDDLLRLSEREILTHAGKISKKITIEHANSKFDKYKRYQLAEPNKAEKDFEKSLKQLEKVEATVKKDK